MSDPIGALARIRGSPPFRAWASAIGSRVESGQSFDAMFLIRVAGAPPSVAWKIVDGWPRVRPHAKIVGYRNRQEMAAVRLACYIPTWEIFDWDAVLRSSLERLSEFKEWRRFSGSPPGSVEEVRTERRPEP